MSRFCPICGRTNVKFIEGLCIECYKKQNPLVKELPELIEINVCTNCGSVLYRSRWLRRGNIVQKIITDSIKFSGKISEVRISEIDFEERGIQSIKIIVKGRASELIDEDYEEEYEVKVKVIHNVCPTCRSIILGKEKAIIQIRSITGSLDKEIVNTIKQIAYSVLAKSEDVQRGAIIDIEEHDYGIDIKTSNNTIAKSIALAIHRVLPSKLIESRKLVGIDRSGKPITKSNISIQIALFKRGDIIRIDRRKIYYVLSTSKQNIVMENLETHEIEKITLNELFRKEVEKIPSKYYCLDVKQEEKLYIVYEGKKIFLSKDFEKFDKVKLVEVEGNLYVVKNDVCLE